MARITQIARIERRLESAFVGTIRHIRVKTLIEPGFKSAFIRAIGAIRVERFFGSGDEAEAGRMGFGKAWFLTRMARIAQIARIKPRLESAFIGVICAIRVERFFGSGDEAEAGRMGFGNAGILTQMTRITLIARIKPEFLSAFIRTIRRIRVRKLRLI